MFSPQGRNLDAAILWHALCFAMMNRGLVCRRIVEVYVAHSNFTTTQSSATPALVLTQGFALSDLWAVASVRLLPCRAVSQGMDGGAIQ